LCPVSQHAARYVADVGKAVFFQQLLRPGTTSTRPAMHDYFFVLQTVELIEFVGQIAQRNQFGTDVIGFVLVWLATSIRFSCSPLSSRSFSSCTVMSIGFFG